VIRDEDGRTVLARLAFPLPLAVAADLAEAIGKVAKKHGYTDVGIDPDQVDRGAVSGRAPEKSGGDAMDEMTPTQELIMDVLGARARTGEKSWCFSPKLRHAIVGLEKAGMVSNMGRGPDRSIRLKLTARGEEAAFLATYTAPVPSLEQAIATIPETNEQIMAWLRAGGMAVTVSPGQVLQRIRDELYEMANG
jgi:hypothetical protein